MDSNKTCQPPPASRKEAKMKPEMVGGNNNSTRTYHPRLTDIKSLPDEVLFEVLVRLSAQDIYDLARLVCSKWYHMIHTRAFIYAHLQRSTYGLLFNLCWKIHYSCLWEKAVESRYLRRSTISGSIHRLVVMDCCWGLKVGSTIIFMSRITQQDKCLLSLSLLVTQITQ
ncbi:hypothetical protein CASFOL_026495 [Castilleja foliolosa]|uniref:F-box domain-containing protein n=1 Tax=Castilleja foliolosa TaxID=1961234 RepID=A0ABD3CH84_9LAMI